MARFKIGNVYPSDEYLLSRCAPAGYGLGELRGHDCTDCNEAIRNGVYYITGDSAINHPGNNMQFGSMAVYRRGDYITQVIYFGHYEAKRFSKDGGSSWGVWEWDNPPMNLGEEYRTIERYMGKPVYAKLVDCKGMPGTGSKTITHNVAGIVEWIVSVQGQVDAGRVFPCKGVDIETSLTDIVIHAENDSMKDAACYVLLKYTKI